MIAAVGVLRCWLQPAKCKVVDVEAAAVVAVVTTAVVVLVTVVVAGRWERYS